MKKLTLVFALVGLFNIGAYSEEHHHDMAGMANIEMAQKTIHGTGKVKSIANDHKSVRIFHDPITELKWPAMNMPFEVDNQELLHGLKEGDKVSFEFIQKEGKNVITKIEK
ncbi:copper-binding protein [Sulfuricurvum sp.]|uniref:copper-binding protein n=1 Tax=Sulfuricurvum sp. TaxID=2025608 RepID=UPI002D3C7517|nr:copper-binding protein [Sulfuricurvum sp.]HZF70285.1 copper-binding protein [Sulfuricurvum sp.]